MKIRAPKLLMNPTEYAWLTGRKRKFHCRWCQDEGWVCESHPDKPWGSGVRCCGAAGMPCRCNKADPPWDFVPASNVVEKTEVPK